METYISKSKGLDPSTIVDEDAGLTAGDVNDAMREIFQETLHERWRRQMKTNAYAGLVLLAVSTGLLFLARVFFGWVPARWSPLLSGLRSMLALWLAAQSLEDWL